MVRKKLVALAAALAAGALTLSACGATNSGSGQASSEPSPSISIDAKWSKCVPGSGSKDVTGMKASDDQDKNIVIAAFNGWDESFAQAHLLKYVLDKDGYTATVKAFDAGPAYVGAVKGDIDIITDQWLPQSQASYIKKFGAQLESDGCWYDNGRLTIAVNKDSPAKSIGDLKSMAGKYQNTLYGIEAGAGETEVVKNSVIPAYGLQNLSFKISSTPAMLSQVKASTEAGRNVAVTLWRPHWAYETYPMRDLKDPKNALGDAENIYSFSPKGFAKKDPKVSQLVKNMAINDKQLSSLEAIMFSKYGGKQDEKAVAEWAQQNPDWITNWQKGKLAGTR